MNAFDKAFLKKNKFVNGFRIGDFESNRGIVSSIPEFKGLYVVVANRMPQKKFKKEGSGVFYKGRNPNVSQDVLSRNWVEGTFILYIGKAGGTDRKGNIIKATLQERITDYIKFGYGYKIGHWGGRLIWQLQYSRDLFIYWRICTDSENPVEMEKIRILEFENKYGKMPFANLRH